MLEYLSWDAEVTQDTANGSHDAVVVGNVAVYPAHDEWERAHVRLAELWMSFTAEERGQIAHAVARQEAEESD